MREMKDSHTEWLECIPQEWELSNIGTLYSMRNTKVSDRDYQPLSVTMKGVVPQLETAAKSDAHDDRKLVKKGDFAINSRSDRRGSCGIADRDGSVSLINTILAPRSEMNPDYYNWLFHTSQFADEFYRWGHGIVDDLWTTRWQEMKKIDVPIPCYTEQEKIADILDAACSKVDALIANQQAQIEKLKAYKQSLITEVVTHGLDPDVPMKYSGVEWIGMIPEGWEVAKIKLLASTCSGGTPPSGDESYYGGDINWVCSYDLHESEIIETIKTLSVKGEAAIAGKIQSPNSILIAMYGGSGTIGNSGLLKCYARTNQAICSVHFDEIIVHPKFAFYHTMFIRKYWMVFAVGTRKDPNISQDIVRNMKYVIPPMEEQKSIVVYLDRKCTKIDALISIKQQKIEKLGQYKKSLIYEYVTGKKEVI